MLFLGSHTAAGAADDAECQRQPAPVPHVCLPAAARQQQAAGTAGLRGGAQPGSREGTVGNCIGLVCVYRCGWRFLRSVTFSRSVRFAASLPMQPQ